MKKLLTLITLSTAQLAFAESGHTPIGSSLTNSGLPAGASVFSANHNPASASLVIAPDEHFRLNYLPAFSLNVEVGDVENFVDEINDLIDILENPALANDSVENTLNHFNDLLHQAGQQGYQRTSIALSAPLFPLYWRPSERWGTFFTELNLNTQIRLGLLDDPLTYDDQSLSFSTATSAYIKSGIETQLALGYSHHLFDQHPWVMSHGQLLGGVKLKIMHLELSKQLVLLQQLDGKDIDDVIKDEYENNLKKTTSLGVDLGLVWVAPSYTVGLTLANINAPSFDYGNIGTNCSQYPENSFAFSNCEAATYFSKDLGVIAQHEVHKKTTYATLDASFSPFAFWSISSSVDTNGYYDLVGMKTQNFSLSTALTASSIWIPDARLAYYKNLQGSQLSSIGLGFTFFDHLTLDAQISLDSIEIDGTKAPRSASFAIALEEKF